MDRNAITTSILLFLIIADVSNASSSFWKLRHLADESPSKNNNTIANTTTPPKSPSSNPVSGSGDKKLDPKRDNPTLLDPKRDNPTILDPKRDNPMILDPKRDNPTILDPKLDNPTILDPKRNNPTILDPKLDKPTILDPKLDNPTILDPKWDNPTILDPKLDNPTILDPKRNNPTILDPKRDKPTILDPKLDNPTILDPKRDNPTILDPNLSNKTDSVTLPLDEKKDPKPSGNKPEKVNPFPQKEINSGNTSSLDSNPKNDRTIEGNEEKKKNVDTGKNPNITKEDNKMKKKKKKANVDDNDSKSVIAETCDGIASRCEDGSSLTACIKGFGTGSKEVVLLVHNSGEKILNVNLVGPFVVSFPKRLRIPEHGTEKINIIFSVSKPSELTLTAGNGDCKIPLIPLASKGNFFSNLPSYDKLLTPVNGACFLIVVVGIIGGSWACCIFRGQHDDGIPYQELEMGLSESMAGTKVETAEGWDQVWDDDWDEDTAVKSPLGRNTADISANVSTARPSNRDGWEDDWDD